jgi:hypothetical protein
MMFVKAMAAIMAEAENHGDGLDPMRVAGSFNEQRACDGPHIPMRIAADVASRNKANSTEIALS